MTETRFHDASAALLERDDLDVRQFAEYFEAIYRDAQGDAARIQWASCRPNAAMVRWLDAVAASSVRCGARVAVVGCGLGDDAKELIRRGYDVTAFDISPTAIAWAKGRDPDNASCYMQADLLAAPARWTRRFDLVVEIHTIQSLPAVARGDVVTALTRMLAPNGRLLVICRAVDEPAIEESGPPWPLTPHELELLAENAGLAPESFHDFMDDETPPVRRVRAVYLRA